MCWLRARPWGLMSRRGPCPAPTGYDDGRDILQKTTHPRYLQLANIVKGPDEKCWELWEDRGEEHGPSQGSGKASERKGCLS